MQVMKPPTPDKLAFIYNSVFLIKKGFDYSLFILCFTNIKI